MEVCELMAQLRMHSAHLRSIDDKKIEKQMKMQFQMKMKVQIQMKMKIQIQRKYKWKYKYKSTFRLYISGGDRGHIDQLPSSENQ